MVRFKNWVLVVKFKITDYLYNYFYNYLFLKTKVIIYNYLNENTIAVHISSRSYVFQKGEKKYVK